MNFAKIEQQVDTLVSKVHTIPGHLTDREARHLALLANLSVGEGEILEIGSFKGKSTILLTLAAASTGNPNVVAVDPLTQPSKTDPHIEGNNPSRDYFFKNLRDAGVEKNVEFHEKLSEDLAKKWDRALRLLWIDGDHTVDGVTNDFNNFAPHLAPGGIIALHDVMHGFLGPDILLIERILRSDEFASAGIVGSIGWAQKGKPTKEQRSQNSKLANSLESWVDSLPEEKPLSWHQKIRLKIKRAQVPHGAIDAEELYSRLHS
jgi:predicted O-methyltransferase YrrM